MKKRTRTNRAEQRHQESLALTMAAAETLAKGFAEILKHLERIGTALDRK